VQHDRGDRQFEVAGTEFRTRGRTLAAFQKLGETHGGLEGVLEIVIAKVDRSIIRMPAGEESLNVGEQPVEETSGLAGMQARENLPNPASNCWGVLGFNAQVHQIS